jgi:hypothetical protein
MNGDSSNSSIGHLVPHGVGIDLKFHDSLLDAYAVLDAAWHDAEEEFTSMRLSIEVRHDVTESMDREGGEVLWLAWTRYRNQWRLCYIRRAQHFFANCWSEEITPIAECPVEIRVQLANQLRPLLNKMEEARRNYHLRVNQAVEDIKAALAD